MGHRYAWDRVESQVAQTIVLWNGCAGCRELDDRRFSLREQQQREKAWDEALSAVERELRRSSPRPAARSRAQQRLVAAFARFAAEALDLAEPAIDLLTHGFLPIGTQLAAWAHGFDEDLSLAGITQACRNAWTAAGLQPLLGAPMRLTPSILAYSLLYPYSDNFLDAEDHSRDVKLRFSRRFRERLSGGIAPPANRSEAALWALVALVESQYPRHDYPQVYDCLLAIHRAQEQSIVQQIRGSTADLLAVSCAKGGTSVLADACLVHGSLSPEASQFSFQWGVLLQLGDDLQDVQEDLQHGSATLFSRAAARGDCLDLLVLQLLEFSGRVAALMDQLPHGDPILKGLLRMSWRSLVCMAIAESQEFFSPQFLSEAERSSPFRFAFLRERRERLAGHTGLYSRLFETFLDQPVSDLPALRLPSIGTAATFSPDPDGLGVC